jgi:hypothetical protein
MLIGSSFFSPRRSERKTVSVFSLTSSAVAEAAIIGAPQCDGNKCKIGLLPWMQAASKSRIAANILAKPPREPLSCQ